MIDGPLRKDTTFSQDLSAAALSKTVTFTRPRSLHEILINFDANVTETITITKNLAVGANYKTVLDEIDLVSEDKYTFRPQGKCDFQIGDGVTVACTNANGTGTAYGTIKVRETYQN